MSEKEKIVYPLKLSSWFEVNTLDWIRSVYFSFAGGSLLALVQKATSLSGIAMLMFVLALVSFFLALYVSVVIVNRFKKYEKLYDTFSIEKRNNTKIESHFYNEEIDQYELDRGRGKVISIILQHYLFYFLGILGLVFMACGGFEVDKSSRQSSTKTKKTMAVLERKIALDDSLIMIFGKMQNEIISLKDSVGKLKSENKSLRDLQNNKTDKKKASKF